MISRHVALSALSLFFIGSVQAQSIESDGELREVASALGFYFGVAVRPSTIDTFGNQLASEFNSLTAENDMKWGVLAPELGVYDFSGADQLVEFAQANNMRVRGHVLYWTRLNGLPTWLPGEISEAADPGGRLRELMNEHAEVTLGRYAGRVQQWDVVNEPLEVFGPNLDPDNLFFQTLGDNWVAEAFEMAHAADPTAELYLNEVLIVNNDTKFEGLYALASDLISNDVPIDGVGIQGHFFFAPPDRVGLTNQLSRIGDLGLSVELTEVDIPIYLFAMQQNPLEAQAQAYADVVFSCLDVEACRGITVWGLNDGLTWLDSFTDTAMFAPNMPLLFDEEGNPKIAYDAVVSALATQLSSQPSLSNRPALDSASLNSQLHRVAANMIASEAREATRPMGAWSFWLEGSFLSGQLDMQGPLSGYDAESTGALAGANYSVSDSLLLGLGGGYFQSDLDAQTTLSASSTETLLGFFNLGYSFNPRARFSLIGIVGDENLDFDRSYVSGLDPVFASSSAGASSYSLHAALFRDYDLSSLKITTGLHADFVDYDRDGFVETGAGVLNLMVTPFNTGSSKIGASLEARKKIAINEANLEPVLRLKYSRDIGSLGRIGSASFAINPDAAFSYSTLEVDRDQLDFEASVRFRISEMVSLEAGYNGFFSNRSAFHTGQARLSLTW